MNQGTKRLTAILGVIMVIAMGSSVILPILNPSNRTVTSTTEAPTEVPIPTFPSPPVDLSVITFAQDIVHPTGLFSVAQPTGWLPLAPITPAGDPATPAAPEIDLNNADRSSIIQAVVQPAGDISTVEQLDAYYSSSLLAESWSAYGDWHEQSRRNEDNQVIIDFELKNRLEQTYVARQKSWVDNGWLYRLRVITPENAPDMLKYLMDNLEPSLKLNATLSNVPLDWKGYFDAATQMAIRFPATWTLTDSALGRVASFSGDNATLRLEAQPSAAAADEAAATKWVETARPGAEVASIQSTTQLELSGFKVAYTFNDADGNAQSGFAVLLNGADGALYSANLRFNTANVDLNTEAGRTAEPLLVQVMDSFTVLAGLNVLLPTPTPSPTPLASATPTTEVTAEATAAIVEATAEVTVEPTLEPTATIKPTLKPTTVPPTAKPTTEPTARPTLKPTNVPPTAKPTTEPTALPTLKPTKVPPTARPTQRPTVAVTTEAEATAEATSSK